MELSDGVPADATSNEGEQLAEQLSQARHEIARLQGALAYRDAYIADLTGSMSWRITAPIRRGTVSLRRTWRKAHTLGRSRSETGSGFQSKEANPFRDRFEHIESSYAPSRPLLVCCHVYHPLAVPGIEEFIARLDVDFQLVATVSGPHQSDLLGRLTRRFPNSRITPVPNHGRDWAPFLSALEQVNLLDFKALLKIHTRRPALAWETNEPADTVNGLLPLNVSAAQVISAFAGPSPLGLLTPQGAISRHMGRNRLLVDRLADELEIPRFYRADFSFPAGSMFWAYPPLISLLRMLPRQAMSFEDEPIPSDGALPHALERLVGLMSAAAHLCVSDDISARVR